MINPDEVAAAWDRIKDFITDRHADINFEERWGTRRLAYPIRKGQYQFLEGNYHLTRFSTEHPFNRELENFLKVDDQVLRSMVTATLPEDELAAQAAAQARAIRTPPPRPAPAGVRADEPPVAPAADGEVPPADAAEPVAVSAEGTVAGNTHERADTESEDGATTEGEEVPVAEVVEEPVAAAEEGAPAEEPKELADETVIESAEEDAEETAE